ncbi:MAG: hypothetical protein K2M91_02090 [Lachnospiraceae bacterium]|nr:hypothetical protein [Lachnospiraceae bacterium]
MNKRLFLTGVAVVVLAVSGGISVYANSSKAEIFSGIDGKNISVYTNQTFSDQKNTSTEITNVKAGDIIDIGDLQEFVIGVSDDGRFLTMPLADYQLEQQNN